MELLCADKKLDLTTPQVMGILNVTPNSFSAVGRFVSVPDALAHARRLYAEGAAVIDVGGEPTNPGVHPVVSLQEELDRVIPVVAALSKELPIPISVDTSKLAVMCEAIAHGACIINDVRGLEASGAIELLAAARVAVVVMHMRYPYGKPSVVSSVPAAANVVQMVQDYLRQRVAACLAGGISQQHIVIDPGIGHGNFGKDLPQNLQLIAQLATFATFNLPILVGLSRKTFIGELLNLPVEERLHGSLAAAVWAVSQGASLIRTHDVRATVEALRVAVAIRAQMIV